VLKNLVTLGTGEVVARAMHAVGFILIARALGHQALGQFGLAVAVTSYVLLFVTQGFDQIAIRQVSREHADLRGYVEQVLGLRLLLAAAAASGVALTCALATGLDPTLRGLLIVLCLSYVANALTPRWSFLAIERPRPIAIGSFVAEAWFLRAAILIQSPSQVFWAAAAQVAGELSEAVYLLWTLRALGHRFGIRFSRAFAKPLVRESWPVTVSMLLGNMMYNFDVVILGAMGKGAEIGLYLACYRLVTVFTPLIAAFQSAVYPSLARSYPDFTRIRARVGWLTLAAAGALAAAACLIAFFARPFLLLLFGGDYVQGATLVQVLVWTLPLQGFRSLLRHLLIAYHEQKVDTRNISFGVVTNVLVDVALIPRWGALGCAVSTLGSEIVFSTLSAHAIATRVLRRGR